MGHESYAKSFLGIKITHNEMKKQYLKIHPEKADDGDSYKYYLEETPYLKFMDNLMKKHNLEYEEINPYDEDDHSELELCVYVWKQETEWMCGRNACGRYVESCSLLDLQKCITQKTDNLRSFMKEFDFDDDSHEIRIITVVIGQ